MVSGSILMIEETVGKATGQHLSLHFFHPAHLSGPCMGATVILPFLNEHWTNSTLYVTEREREG